MHDLFLGSAEAGVRDVDNTYVPLPGVGEVLTGRDRIRHSVHGGADGLPILVIAGPAQSASAFRFPKASRES